MSETITVINKNKEHALFIPEVVGTLKLGKVMGPAYESILELLKKHDVELNEKSMPFTKYNNIDWERMNKKGLFSFINIMFFYQWDLQIGITCPDSVSGEGHIRKMSLEEGEFIRTLHKGPYQKVGDTYTKMLAYAKAHNLKIDNYSIEFYLNDPRETKSTDLETEVLVPLIQAL